MPEKALSILMGERLRKLRKEKGMTQEQLANVSNLHPTYIGQLERGEKNATLATIEKVSDALGISIERLFETEQSNDSILILTRKLQGMSGEGLSTLLKMVDVMLEWDKMITKGSRP